MASPQTMQDDPNVKLPPAVQAQADRANALMAAVAANQQIEIQQELDPALDANALALQPELDPNAPPAEAPKPAPAPAPAEDNWEHKFKSEVGRNAALRDQLAGMSAQVQNLQNVLAAMNQPALDQPAGELTFESLTDDERREYGEDLLGVVGKKAMAEVAPILKKMQDRLDAQAATIKSLSGTQSVNAQQKVLDVLDDKVPGWRVINDSEEFLAWLALPDAFSGAIRHNMLKEAFAQGNASRVMAFFSGFNAEAAATAPAGTPKPTPAADPAPRVTLEELAAPGKAKAAPSSAGAEAPKPIITRAQISAFYAEVAAGRWKGRDAEKLAAEKMIFDAGNEGRIR